MQRAFCNRISWAALALAAFPISALADLSGTTTLTATQSLNLESGATATSGGDLLWNGSSITPQGTAKAGVVPGITGVSGFALLDQTTLQALVSLGSSSPIPSASLPVGTILGVLTNATHVAKVLVTANSGGSITLQFTTFGATGGGGGGGPTISRVTNNSSDIPSGFPNSGISQGALFKIVGSGLADDGDATLHDSNAAGGLPTTLNGARVAVTVGSTTVNVALYYATPSQIDAVLPSNMPTGSGTVTVTHNGTATATIQVVTAAPGITTYNNGATVVAQDFARPTDPYGGLITFQKSAVPGGIITVWGSGFGATTDSDTTYTGAPHATSVPYSIYIGGVQVTNVAYVGRSVYPGVHVFVLTIPQNVPTGCYVPFAVVTGNVVSNIATLPIKAGGGVCTDPQLGLNGDQLTTLSGQTSVKSGFLVVSQSTAPTVGVTNSAFAFFQQSPGVSAPGGGGVVSIGGCIISQTTTGGTGGLPTGLNAGTITVTGPGASPVTLTGVPILPGFYTGTLASIPSTGGAFVFNGTAGSGANAVGAFTATVTFPNPLMAWTNQSAAATITRTQGLTVTWTGGAPGTYVVITGSAASGTATGSYSCFAPQSAGSFTVPSYVLLGLPAASGTTTVQNSTNLGSFSATGIDFGYTLGTESFTVNSNYN